MWVITIKYLFVEIFKKCFTLLVKEIADISTNGDTEEIDVHMKKFELMHKKGFERTMFGMKDKTSPDWMSVMFINMFWEQLHTNH